MRKTAASLTTLGAMLLALPYATAVRAQSPETWLSAFGNNRNPCSRTLPCRTFERAIAETLPGGRIGILDAGNFEDAIIEKSISITNDGPGEARIIRSVWIIAGPNDRVFLRGLTIEGGGGGSAAGIYFDSGAALHVQNCVIKGAETMPAYGIRFAPSGASELYVSNTVIAANGSSVVRDGRTVTGGGVLIRPTETGNATIVINRVRIENNLFGIEADGSLVRRPPTEPEHRAGVSVTVQGSVIAGNAGNGITAITTDEGATVSVAVDRSSSIYNARGIHADGAKATIRLNNSTVTGNQTGLSSIRNGRLDYSRNNNISGNTGINIDEPPSGL